MQLRVFFPRPPRPACRATLLELLEPAVDVVFGDEAPAPPDTTVLVEGRPRRADLEQSPALSAVVIPYAGVPAATRELLLEFPRLSVHNLHHNSAPTAETAVALLLAAAKRLVPADARLRAGDWRHPEAELPSFLLEGRTAVIAGYGAVGRRVARACAALGMTVHAIRRDGPNGEDGVATVHSRGALRELLPRADVLVLALPATPETRGLIGGAELASLPRASVLVNVARGDLVDEQALYEGLRTGRPAAAGIDTWFRYPEDDAARAACRPSQLPFHELPNVVMSPHRAGRCDETESLRGAHLAVMLNLAAQGAEMHNRVDVARGY